MAALTRELGKTPRLGFKIYAENVSIWTKNEDIERQQVALKTGLDTIEAHLHKVDLQTTTEKNYVAVAPKRQRETKIGNQLYLVLAGKRIQPSTSDRIIRLIIEEKGKGGIWLQGTLQHCNSATNSIKRICSAKGGATDEITRRMVKALVVSQVCYGARH